MMRDDEMAQAAGAASREDSVAGSLRLAMTDSGPRGASPPLRIEQSAPARSDGLERLAQLARLIEQDETLAAIVRDGQSEPRVDLSLRREKPPSPHPAREEKAFEHNWEGETGSILVHRGSCDEPTGEPHNPPEYGEYDGPDYSNGLPDQRRGLRAFAALIGLALAGSTGAFAYWALPHGRGHSDEARMMAASTGPDKIAPSPRENSRLDEGLGDQSDERSVNATGGTMAGVEEPADAKPPMTQALPPTSIAFGQAPTKMAELTPGPTPPGSPAEAVQNQPPDVKKPAPRQTAPGAPEPSGAHDLRHVVQLSSERGEAAAHARSRVLQTKYRDALAGRQPFIRRADLGDRGVYYRVQMGPFSIEEANQICESLKKSGADCIVHRN
jgi:SPOR domain